VRIEWLACPSCGSDLVEAGTDASPRFDCARCNGRYPIVRGIPRFVPADNYAASFGFQWNRFSRTQLDSANGTRISRDRFLAQSGWTPESLNGALVLDAGAGSGRFAEVALSLGAEVVAIDYSGAIDAIATNFPNQVRLHLMQADLLNLPLKPAIFDFVYCFGVLQHTADPRKAVMSLATRVKSGGRLAVDVYRAGLARWTHPRFWLRPFTRGMKPETLLKRVEWLVRAGLPISNAAGHIPLLGRVLQRAIPVANHTGRLPLSPQQLREWAVLDTFDWLSAAYDQPQTADALASWSREAGLVDVEVCQPVMLTVRGRQP
jgi:SAM-dependent methyltransferase